MPAHPYKPNTTQSAGLGLLTGIFIGAAFIVMRERADRTIQQPGDTSFYLNVPELGIIPSEKTGGSRLRTALSASPDGLPILSPERAILVRQLAAVVPDVTSAPLSVNLPAAVLNLFTFTGYIGTFLVVRDLAWRFSARPWAVSIPLIAIAGFEATIGMFQVFAGWPSANASGTYVDRDHFAGLLEMIFTFPALYGVAILRGNKAVFTSSVPAAVGTCVVWAAGATILLAIIYSLSRMGFVAALSALFTVGALSIGPRLPSNVGAGCL